MLLVRLVHGGGEVNSPSGAVGWDGKPVGKPGIGIGPGRPGLAQVSL